VPKAKREVLPFANVNVSVNVNKDEAEDKTKSPPPCDIKCNLRLVIKGDPPYSKSFFM